VPGFESQRDKSRGQEEEDAEADGFGVGGHNSILTRLWMRSLIEGKKRKTGEVATFQLYARTLAVDVGETLC
jgi:hypothetical protein